MLFGLLYAVNVLKIFFHPNLGLQLQFLLIKEVYLSHQTMSSKSAKQTCLGVRKHLTSVLSSNKFASHGNLFASEF